jgi:hypothetical protein
MMIVPIYAKVSIKRRKEYEKYKETHCFLKVEDKHYIVLNKPKFNHLRFTS